MIDGMRRLLAFLAGLVACVALPLSIAAVWTDNVVNDRDEYVDTVGPLAEDSRVQEAVADRLADIALERMSLGQRRRACLGAALLGPPKLLVLDEPDNGLDARRTEALVEVVRAHAAGGGGSIISTHDRALLDAVGARLVSLA